MSVAVETVKNLDYFCRNEYQGVKSVSGAERDFLRDEYITSNKPYIR